MQLLLSQREPEVKTLKKLISFLAQSIIYFHLARLCQNNFTKLEFNLIK